jgi:hypothetical protein
MTENQESDRLPIPGRSIVKSKSAIPISQSMHWYLPLVFVCTMRTSPLLLATSGTAHDKFIFYCTFRAK